jgi:hypothetical protein
LSSSTDPRSQEAHEGCLLCDAERISDWHFEDEDCWVADCIVCATPMIVWRTHGLPEARLEARLLSRLERVAAARYGDEGYWLDAERRRIPDHWHAHARPAGGFFDPGSQLYGRYESREE